MNSLSDSRATVVGLGLMGASLASALRGRCKTVTGVAQRAETIEVALDRGLIDKGTTHLNDGLTSADIVILATPVRTIIRLLREIGPHLTPECLVMDLGSTKAQIVAAMEELPESIQPVGGHPMCGKESAGIAAAEPALYHDCTFILTPLQRTSKEAQALSLELVHAVGGRPLVLSPDHPDQLVATISHLPYLLACALVGTAQETAAADPVLWDVAASGFLDTSRLAASDLTMMIDILMTNREKVLKSLLVCEGQLHNLAESIASLDETRLRKTLVSLRDRRAAL